MKTVRGLSRKEFDNKFGTNEQCLTFLATQKWGAGFTCRSCGYDKAYKGKKQLNKRCKSCGKEESPTAHTVFHKVKFDLYKAFGMLYDVLTSKKGASSIWLAERYEVSQNTAWLFRRKLQNYLKSSGKHPLTLDVHVDEFEIGTPKKGKQGRANTDEKIRVVIAAEIRKGKVGNAYARVISDFSTKSLKNIFDLHISEKASVKTDGWRGYSPLKRLYKKLVQEKSDNGANFPEIHIQIRNLKNWLRGVHSYCSFENMQCYLDEYFFRFNRRNFRNSIMNNIFDRLLNEKALTYKEIISIAT
jgi:hypothetical protein